MRSGPTAPSPCSEWTGVRLADVLKAAGLKSDVVYTAHEGADTHPSGAASGLPISRGVPIAKALDPDSLIAFAQNGQPIHSMNGAPLRLVFPDGRGRAPKSGSRVSGCGTGSTTGRR